MRINNKVKINRFLTIPLVTFLSSLLSACNDWSWIDLVNEANNAEPTDKHYIYKPAPSEESKVFYIGSFEKGFQLVVDGKPFEIKGAGLGPQGDMAKLKEYGANTIRTWASINSNGTDLLGGYLDEAHAHGLKVIAGLWVPHERHGYFNYSDPVQFEAQLRCIR